jgi:hypothetical protein
MKKVDVLKLNEVFNLFADKKYGVKFSYFLARNKIAIKSEVEALEEVRKPDQEFLDFELERITLAREYADKDSEDKPIIQNNAFIILKQIDLFENSMKSLKIRFKDVIEKRELQMKELEKILDEDFSLEKPFRISFSDLPSEIEPSIVEILITCDLIKDE